MRFSASAFARATGIASTSAAALAAIVASAAHASVPVDLRVASSDAGNLADVREYVPDSSKVDTYSGPDCFTSANQSSGQSYTLGRPTFLGAIWEASKSVPALQPVRLSDANYATLGALGVCQINAKTPPGFFNLRANHNNLYVGADLFTVHGGEELLAYRTPSDFSTSGELDLSAPVRTAPGQIVVNVRAYDANTGVLSVRQGATVIGGDAPATTNANGDAVVTLSTPGIKQLVATGAYNDIPSPTTSVCVDSNPEAHCAAARGRQIYGSDESEAVRGTDGDDLIVPRGSPDGVRAGAGDDTILAKDGFKDKINCGGGIDTVKRDRKDRLAKNCEKVKGKKKKGGRRK